MLNLLHLLAVLAIAACLYAQSREARGISQSRGYLMVPPPLAFGCAIVMIGLTEPTLQQPKARGGGTMRWPRDCEIPRASRDRA